MTRRPLFLLAALGLAALALGGCKSEPTLVTGPNKHLQPVPEKTLALMKDKGMTRRDPILIRIYKETSELEVWKQNQAGRYALLKTYEICRFSGTLGPKKTEGDGQSPEGFYQVSMGQMNPKSQYYLAFNLGFPNAFDRSHGRTGAHLMVHGDCLSKGCYAMTDEQMAEVYALAREALSAGQPSFQVQAFPFRMTAENMARRRNDENFAFWQNLKEGADQFEVTKLEPKVNVCGKKYVFNADASGGSFSPDGACPPHQVNPSIASAIAGKERADREKFDKLVSGGLEVAEAYAPQNGRLRRSLNDPIRPTQPKPVVMTAEAKSRSPQQSFALAMADSSNAVPMPVPSPYAAQQPKPQKAWGGAFAWLRPGNPSEPPSSTTPAAAPSPASQSVATARRAPEPGTPIAASLAPVQSDQPFYKRWMGFGGRPAVPPAVEAAPAPAAPRAAIAPAQAAVPTPRPASVPTPAAAARPAAPAPAAAPSVQIEAQPQPAPQKPAEPSPAQPSRADAAFKQFGSTQIVNPGSFR